MLTDSDLDALLRWGGLTVTGSRSERLQCLTSALARHRTPASPKTANRVSSRAGSDAWLVNPLSGWRFPLSAARSAPGVPVILGRKSNTASLDKSGVGLSEIIGLPSDSKTISRRHAEVCFGLPRPQSHAAAATADDGRFHLRSLQGGKKTVLHNGRKLQPSADDGDGWVALEDGDRIIVGPCLLHFRVFDDDSGACTDTTAPSDGAVAAAIRALTQLERKLLLGRDPSLQQHAADDTMRAWLDSSAFAAAAFAGDAEAYGGVDGSEIEATLTVDELAQLEDADDW